MKLRLTFNAGRKGDTDVLMTRTVEADYVLLDGLGVGNAPDYPIDCRSGDFPLRMFVAVAVREPEGLGLTYKTILTVEKIDD